MFNLTREQFILIVGVIGIIIFIVRLRRLMRQAKRIESEGTVVSGVVSRLEYETEDGGSCTVYVRFRDDTGEMRESPAGVFLEAVPEQGQSVRIRFIPGEYDMVRIVTE